MNVLIVGNITKDVYLRLDERRNKFELDEDKNPWMNVCFDGSTHHYFRRNSVLGGAAVTLEVLKKFGLDAKIMNSRLSYEDGEIRNAPNVDVYRYILCHGDKITYFSDNKHVITNWNVPEDTIDWIFIDRSANINQELVDSIETFLSVSQHTKLAIFAKQFPADCYANLAIRADLIFSESDIRIKNRQICVIRESSISLDEKKQSWHLPNKDLLTHLTAHSIIAATVLGAMITGKGIAEALKLAKTNVENATLDRTLSLNKLEELV